MPLNLKKTISKPFALLLVLFLVLSAAGCSSGDNLYESSGRVQAIPEDGILTVEYIDVGQADSILITGPTGEHMLIDAGATLGTNENFVEPALEEAGVEDIDVAIATHPHFDHIACMDDVIRSHKIGKFYLPDTEGTYTSSTYTKMLDELKKNNIEAIYPKVPSEFDFDGTKCEILGPLHNETKSCNEYSIVLRMTYGENTFLFTGDAGSSSEYNMIDRGFDLSADVLKVGHHGSKYSTTREFVAEVDPEIAVISCSEDNDYGYPPSVTLSRLGDIPVYITKDCGSITITSDGQDLKVYTEKEASPVQTEKKSGQNGETTYIGNINSKIYHEEGCGSLPAEKNRVYFSSREEAEKEGYTAHSCVE